MEPKKPVVRQIETSVAGGQATVPTWLAIALLVISGLIGGFGGWALAGSKGKSSDVPTQAEKTSKSAGIKDTKRFPDSAVGILKEGGIDGEGNFHLQRPGGESQNVYLTSSIVDLSDYLNKKIKVNGQTFESQTAGWLMDVGYVELQ